MIENSTVCALSTPRGKGGIGVIRVSGEEALEITEKIIVSNKMNNPTELYGIEVCLVDEASSLSGAKVICGVSSVYMNEVALVLENYNCEMVQLDVDAIIRYYVD